MEIWNVPSLLNLKGVKLDARFFRRLLKDRGQAWLKGVSNARARTEAERIVSDRHSVLIGSDADRPEQNEGFNGVQAMSI
jgi:hypothetical protein